MSGSKETEGIRRGGGCGSEGGGDQGGVETLPQPTTFQQAKIRFLAVQDSSIGDIVSESVRQTFDFRH